MHGQAFPRRSRYVDSEHSDVTLLLQRIADGDASASHELLPIVYAELRALAHAQFDRGALIEQTIQPTALVHEVFLKLFGKSAPTFENRGHFLAVSASAMRSILVDRARARSAEKRGGAVARVPLDSLLIPFEENGVDVLALDVALRKLTRASERAARIVELRFFGGLEHTEVARVMDISVATVEREWRTARAWLRRELREAPDGGVS